MRQTNKISKVDFERSVILLYEKTKRFKELESKFKQIKESCTKCFDEYFAQNHIDKSQFVQSDDEVLGGITVTKVQRTSVKFDANKLERALKKSVASKAIEKRYEIIDMKGLVEYLKTCDVDPQIFKSFIDVTKTVNVNELERLSELGEIDDEQVEGCYTITNSDPYYKLRVSRGDGDN